jgi:choline dehydrogenase-like flavoprotein
MIRDFASTDVPADFDSDLCIVGAGAVGIAIALEFCKAPHRVVVLESGGEHRERETQRLYDSELRGLRCSTVHEGRARVFGGTTTMWAGQALPLDEVDFARRSWVEHSGWPISGDQLQPYYRRAERLMGLPGASYGEPGWPTSLPRPPLVPGTHRRFSTFSPTPNFATVYRAALAGAANVTVLLHANATRLVMSEDGSRVDAIEIQSLSGRAGSIRGRRFVLCCGGVETPRLLLASHRARSQGIGNGHDLVGRFFQEHLHVNVPVVPEDRRAIARVFNSKRLRHVPHFAKVSATAALQQRKRILNVGSNLTYDPDANVAVRAVKELDAAIREGRLWDQAPRALLAAVRHPAQLATAGYSHAIRRQKASEGVGAMYICVQAENAPRPESRVTVDRHVDALGMPRAVVDWRIGEAELRTIELFARRVDELLRTGGLGRLDLSGFPLERDLGRLSQRVAGGCHHIGTTRMSEDMREGVVDRDCRVHGVQNLFVAGSAVFPTSGWSNPTLTLLALGLRLADHLMPKPAATSRAVSLAGGAAT